MLGCKGIMYREGDHITRKTVISLILYNFNTFNKSPQLCTLTLFFAVYSHASKMSKNSLKIPSFPGMQQCLFVSCLERIFIMKLLMGEPSMLLYLFCYKFNFTEFEYLYWVEYREKQKLHAKLKKVLVRSLCFVLITKWNF